MGNFIITLIFISILVAIVMHPLLMIIAMIAIPAIVLKWCFRVSFGFVVDSYFLTRRGRINVEEQVGKHNLQRIDID